MTQNSDLFCLTGKMLIAMPGMGDPRFDKSVILICAHSKAEAMGLIVNKPAPGLTFRELLTQLEITPGEGADMPVQLGGPVEHGRGFVLHSTDYTSNGATLQVPGGYALTATLDVLEDVARGFGPSRAILALGYSGWGPGQLEREIGQNGWLTCDARADIVFGTDPAGKWEAALRSMGIDPLTLSAVAGRA